MKDLLSRSLPMQNDRYGRSAVVVTGRGGNIEGENPSELLGDNDWVVSVCGAFEGVVFRSVDEEMRKQADAMLPHARMRLWEHKFARIDQADWHGHWSLLFFEENLPRLCAILALAGHVRTDVICAKRDTCLLARPANNRGKPHYFSYVLTWLHPLLSFFFAFLSFLPHCGMNCGLIIKRQL